MSEQDNQIPKIEIKGETSLLDVVPALDSIAAGEKSRTIENIRESRVFYEAGKLRAELLKLGTPDNSNTKEYVIQKATEIVQELDRSERYHDLAHYDLLTGLPNRRSLEDEYKRRTEENFDPQAILFLDIDNFKQFNSTYGHEVGDAVLQEVAKRLTASVRQSIILMEGGIKAENERRKQPQKADLIGRLGGEEFLGIINVQNIEELSKVVAQIQHSFQTKPFLFRLNDGTDVEKELTVSIGGTFMKSKDEPWNNSVKRANDGLTRAKNEGKNTFRFVPLTEENTS